MEVLAHYALLGSLIAGAAGALVLTVVTLKHGIRRRIAEVDDEIAATSPRTARSVRLADTVAVLCFAVAAGLGVIGLMEQTRALATAARTDESRLVEWLLELDQRITRAESQLQTRAAATERPEGDERAARIDRRLGTLEERAANVERLAREQREDRLPAAVAAAPRRALPTTVSAARPPKATPTATPSASPAAAGSDRGAIARELKPETAASAAPSASVAPPAPAGAPPVVIPPPAAAPQPPVVAPPPSVAAVPASPAEDVTPSKTSAPAREPGFTEKVSQGWDSLKRGVERGGDEWRDGWRRLMRLFGD